MARQKIINVCPYKAGKQRKCPDFEGGVSVCKYGRDFKNCKHHEPTQLFGYSLTDEEVEKLIN